MSLGMQDADPKVVAKFLDVPVPLVQEQLDSMSDTMRQYLEVLFVKYLESSNA